MTKRELREAADGLRRILAAVERGELDCPPSLVTRLDGARVALAALGESDRSVPMKPTPPSRASGQHGG